MKEGWKYMKLGDCFTSINNGANIKQIKGAGGLPITRIETISNDIFNRDRLGYADITSKETFKKYQLNDGDILMSHINSMKFLGRSVVYKKKDDEYIIHGMNLLRLVPKCDCFSVFMAYLFMSPSFREQLLTISHQSVNQASFNITALKGLVIPVPSLSDQQRIVTYLDAEFAKIEALKANAEKQLQAAKDLFQAALKELLTPKEGWEEKKFGDVCHYYKVQGKWENIEYIGLEHIEAHTSNLLATISANDVESSTFKFNKGDVLYGRLRPYLQKVVIAPFDGCCSTEIFPIKSNIINNAFLKYWLLSDRVTEIMINSCSGCRMPRANMNDFKQETIHYPQDLNEQQRIADRLDALSANVKALQTNYAETITLCNDLKQALLKKVFG